LPRIRRWLPQLEDTAGPGLPATVEGMLRRVCRLQKFLSDIVETPEPHAVSWLESSMDILATRPDLSPATIARSLGLSYETFRKEFARHTGQPPARYRLHRLIEQARVLISERNLSNKQIAETLGFYDEFHFSRHFRHITGGSTRDFRRSLH
jgi:AraC-like DNA-binding protein